MPPSSTDAGAAEQPSMMVSVAASPVDAQQQSHDPKYEMQGKEGVAMAAEAAGEGGAKGSIRQIRDAGGWAHKERPCKHYRK